MQDRKADDTSAAPASSRDGEQTATNEDANNGVHRLLHQLNQPLTAISNYARAGIQLIDNGMTDAARMKELFEKIATQSGRTTALSQDLGAAITKLVQGEEPE
jgi:hypothetical protein